MGETFPLGHFYILFLENQMNFIKTGLLILFSATAVSAHHELEGKDITRGSKNYQDYCASCHGVNLEGEPNWREFKEDGSLPAPPHDDSGHTWHHDVPMLFTYTKIGGQAALAEVGVTEYNSGMPAFGDLLTDEEILEILAYIRSTWSQEIQDLHATRHPNPLFDN